MELIEGTELCTLDDGTAVTTAMATLDLNEASENSTNLAYIFIPILLIEFLMSMFSNWVLLLLIGRSYNSLTTLNVFLLSLGVLNLILSVNQLTLLGVILSDGRPIPYQICHISFGIQSLGKYGITFLQLAISYNRYHSSINPVYWERSSLQKAWVTAGMAWVVMLLLAALISVLHIGDIDGSLKNCFWPITDDHTLFSLLLHLVLFVVIVAAVAAAAHYHRKTISLLNLNRMTLVREMEMTSSIQYYEMGQSSPEKTAKSLIVMFVIQMGTLLVPLTYDIIRLAIVAVEWAGTGRVDDPSPTLLLVFMTTCSLFTTTSPFFLMLVSQRFKKNVTDVFKKMCRVGQESVFLHSNSTIPRIRKEHREQLLSNVPNCRNVSYRNTARHDVDISIFMGEGPSEVYRYREPAIGLGEGEEEEEEERLDKDDIASTGMSLVSITSESDLWGSSCMSASVGKAAVQSGLVLAVGGAESRAVKEFFVDEERLERERF